jgi:hypothetical protein
MVVFEVDEGQKKREILEKFKGGPVLLKCLYNRLEYCSKYSDQIENQIDKYLPPPEDLEWLSLLD